MIITDIFGIFMQTFANNYVILHNYVRDFISIGASAQNLVGLYPGL